MTDFELQTQSGQLWLDIIERLAAKDAIIAAITAERDAHAQTIAAFLAADDAGVVKIREDAAKTADEKERDAAQAEFEAAQAAADAAKAKLDALK